MGTMLPRQTPPPGLDRNDRRHKRNDGNITNNANWQQTFPFTVKEFRPQMGPRANLTSGFLRNEGERGAGLFLNLVGRVEQEEG